MCLSVLPAGICAHHMHAWFPHRLTDGAYSSESRTTDDCEPPCGFWEQNPGPLQEQQVLLNAEPSLQPLGQILGSQILRWYQEACDVRKTSC